MKILREAARPVAATAAALRDYRWRGEPIYTPGLARPRSLGAVWRDRVLPALLASAIVFCGRGDLGVVGWAILVFGAAWVADLLSGLAHLFFDFYPSSAPSALHKLYVLSQVHHHELARPARFSWKLVRAARRVILLALAASIAASARADEFADALAAFDAGDYGKSHEAMLALAERGHARAELLVIGNFYMGWGIPPSVDSARSWAFYARQDASQADFDFVIGRWRAMAEAGDALAQTMLGFSFNNAFGVPLDESAAFQWIKRSAIQGNPRGQHALGTLYGNGQGTPKNLKLALECFELAAAQGDSESQEDIGNAYQFGLGVRKNNALAATWYRKAAEAGNASAAYNLAYMYDAGRGMRRDYTEALKWYGVAAMHGSVLALNNLAVMYLLGEGVARDPAVAYEFASLARAKMRLVYNPADASTILRAAGRAESKLDAAQRRSALFALGERCRDGSGVPRDYVEAYRWMMVSAADEPDDATRKTRNAALEELASRMHPEAVARAKRLTP